MTIRQFVPVAAAAVAGLTVGATKLGVPAPPITVISTVACVLLALQLEDHKLGDLLGELIQAFKKEQSASR